MCKRTSWKRTFFRSRLQISEQEDFLRIGKCRHLPSSGRTAGLSYAAALISLMRLFFPTTPNTGGERRMSIL